MVGKRGETDCASQVTFFGYIDNADDRVGDVTRTGFTSVRATVCFLRNFGFIKILEEVVFVREVVDVWALPMGGREVPVFLTVFGNLDFAVFLCEFCFYFFLAFWAYAFGLRQVTVSLQ